jgi:hypothetical protein
MEKQATGDYPNDQISFRLHHAAHLNQEAAEAAIGKIRETDKLLRERTEAAIGKMRETDELLRQRIQTLPDWVAGEVDKRLEKAVRDAAEQITVNVTASLKAENEAARRATVQYEEAAGRAKVRYEEAASRATVRYENAAKFAVRRVVGTALGCFVIGCIGMITGVYVAARLILPAPDVLQREREAEQTVEKLAPRGGNSILTMCQTAQGVRQCVRTDERGQPTPFEAGGGTYRIIYGY